MTRPPTAAAICGYGTMTISYSTIAGDSAGFGGGACNVQTLVISHCTIADNSAGASGGGIGNLAAAC